jgi:hypothetical protein
VKLISAPCLPTLADNDTLKGNVNIYQMAVGNAQSRPSAAMIDINYAIDLQSFI